MALDSNNKTSSKERTLDDLSKPELLGLIKHRIGSTLTKGHPVRCACCGTRPDRVEQVDGALREVYWFVCDRCEGRETTQTARQKAAQEWCDKYSSPGDFEEFGQHEAFSAGWNAREALKTRPAKQEGDR